jgi:hypothetical protein
MATSVGFEKSTSDVLGGELHLITLRWNGSP